MTDCIFCKIVAGELPSHTVYEDDKHLAFLSIFPNTDGFTVVIPKQHFSSYIFEQSDEVMDALMRATKTVAKKIDAAFADVGRCAMIFEGYGVNHLHSKLVPLHGTADDSWEQKASRIDTFFESYPGYISSNDSARADDELLAAMAEKIRNA